MKVLQVASFDGNVGDNVNHEGFRSWFSAIVRSPVEWTEFEIRDTYRIRNKRSFDLGFAELANRHDLVVIGGGNYFELWVGESATGTSVNIAAEVLDAIRTPIYINSLGVDTGMGIAADNVERFVRFLEALRGKDALVSVRNDGAAKNLRSIGVDPQAFGIHRFLDGGFHYRIRADAGGARTRRIGINLAGDMLETRFPGEPQGITYGDFLLGIKQVIESAVGLDPALEFVLFPHIYKDLRVYSDLLDILDDTARRERVTIAKCGHGPSTTKETVESYAACDLVLGMRFHSNVICLANSIPVLGLSSYPQIANLYEEVDLPQNCVELDSPAFPLRISRWIANTLQDDSAERRKLADVHARVEATAGASASSVGTWLSRHGLA